MSDRQRCDFPLRSFHDAACGLPLPCRVHTPPPPEEFSGPASTIDTEPKGVYRPAPEEVWCSDCSGYYCTCPVPPASAGKAWSPDTQFAIAPSPPASAGITTGGFGAGSTDAPEKAWARVYGALAPPPPEEATLDSPDYRPPEVDELAARGFKRVNRHAPAAAERVVLHRHPEWTEGYYEACINSDNEVGVDEQDRLFTEYEHAEYVPARLLEEANEETETWHRAFNDLRVAFLAERERCIRECADHGCMWCQTRAAKIREGK